MRLYLVGVPTKGGNPPEVLVRAAGLGESAGSTILSNIPSLSTSSISKKEVAEADAKGEVLLDHMNAFIIDGTVTDPQIGYTVAYALFRKKHLLYLLPRGRSLDPTLALLAKRKENQRYFQVRYHIPQTLAQYVNEFLRLLSLDPKDAETPSIKFTLRITPNIDQYLNWRARRKGIKKADFVRHLVDEELKNDKLYSLEKEK